MVERSDDAVTDGPEACPLDVPADLITQPWIGHALRKEPGPARSGRQRCGGQWLDERGDELAAGGRHRAVVQRSEHGGSASVDRSHAGLDDSIDQAVP